jgi:DNA topoisomerase-1
VVTDEKGRPVELKADLSERLKTKEEAIAFLEQCKDAKFVVENVEKKPLKRYPAAPFTTSTLQQEVARKLGYSVSQTMSIAQKLYESGKITYMRTDSVNLSNLALNAAKEEICAMMGEKYHHTRHYQTKSKVRKKHTRQFVRPISISMR